MSAKNYHLHWIAGRANILCKNLLKFFIFGCDFCGSFSMLFPEASVSCDKKVFEMLLVIKIQQQE